MLQRGLAALSDAELLALLLGTGHRGKNVLQLCRDLLSEFGGLADVAAAPAEQVQGVAGLGVAKYAVIQAALEIARRCAMEGLAEGAVLTSPEKTRHFLALHLGSRDREIFCCIFLDSQHAVLCCEDLFLGTLDGAAVYPREVAVRALRYRAAAVILAHNHPSGVAEPSEADRRITRRLQSGLSLLDVRVLDHIIIGRGRQFSFAEQGLL
jgi:DNA repair protein RadC